MALIAKVDKFYDENGLSSVEPTIFTHHVIEDAIASDESLGDSALKHLKQNSSLLGNFFVILHHHINQTHSINQN